MTGKGKELRSRIKELAEALEREQSATSLATKELQVRFPGFPKTLVDRLPGTLLDSI